MISVLAMSVVDCRLRFRAPGKKFNDNNIGIGRFFVKHTALRR